MAGTVTTTEYRTSSVKKIKFEWTSSSGGAADATTTYRYDGELLRTVFIPSATAAPSSGYGVTIKDSDGVDILEGNGSSRSGTVTEQLGVGDGKSPYSAVSNTKLTLGITSAGNAKKGQVILYIR